MPFIISIVLMEAVLHIKAATQQQIHRLEIINNFSRQISLSLETERTMSLLNTTIRETLEADTYFIFSSMLLERQISPFPLPGHQSNNGSPAENAAHFPGRPAHPSLSFFE